MSLKIFSYGDANVIYTFRRLTDQLDAALKNAY